MSNDTVNIEVLSAQYKGRVSLILKDHGNVQSKIHEFMVSLFKDVINNTVPFSSLNELYSGLGKGVNKKAIKDWIHTFSPLRWNEEKQGFVRAKAHKWDMAMITDGSHNPYYLFDKPKKVSNPKFDYDKKVTSLVKAMDKVIAEAHTAGVDCESLERILASLKLLES
jgi:hypothetical protein